MPLSSIGLSPNIPSQMDKAQQEAHRATILARIAEIEENLAGSAEDTKAISPDKAIGRLSRLDSMQMQQMALGMKQRMREELRRLQDALARIDRGAFGTCQLCGNDIPQERLEYQPDAVTCVDCLNRARR